MAKVKMAATRPEAEDEDSTPAAMDLGAELEILNRRLDKTEDEDEIEDLIRQRRDLRKKMERRSLQKRLADLENDDCEAYY